MSLILEGFMGSGKSAVGRRLSGRHGVLFLDTDSGIEERQGQSVAKIFEDCGEEAFRQMETSMLYGLLLSGSEGVISLGGGTPVREANRSVIKKLGKVIYLRASRDTLAARLENGTEERPMLKGHDLGKRIEELIAAREEKYISLADFVIETDDLDVDDICDRIEEICPL